MIRHFFKHLYTVSLAGAERVDASEPVELDRESPSLTGKRNVSLIHLRYSITSSVTRIILPSMLRIMKVSFIVIFSTT